MHKLRKALLMTVFSSCELFCLAEHNYIQNPGFEENSNGTKILSGPAQHKQGEELAAYWYQPTKGTPDYYNSDSSRYFVPGQKGYERFVPKAKEGKCRMSLLAYAGKGRFKNLYSEYIQSKLKMTLDSGKTYRLRFFLYFDSLSGFSASNFGAFFTEEKFMPGKSTAIRYTPQALCEASPALTVPGYWHEITLRFVANGNENYITLGSFEYNGMCPAEHKRSPSADTELKKFAYYHLDDLSLIHESDTTHVKNTPFILHPYCKRTISKRRFLSRLKNTTLVALYVTAVYGGAYLIYTNQKK